ncbi:MAG: DNA repair protein RecN [Myxococcales bacterium]|nr:DNA repair protein RecN [Myxococcales bacterium]
MLSLLRIKSFILIDALELELEPGLNVLTGETGAGKSNIVQALGLVLGQRPRGNVVRGGASEAEVEALFDLNGCEVTRRALAEAGLDAETDEVVIRRVVNESGRTRAYLNGRLSTTKQLASVAKILADVTSQHESVRLVDAAEHLDYLDRYARLTELRRELESRVESLLELDARLVELSASAHASAEREGFFRYQLEGIDKLAPAPGELDALELERSRLKHATRLAEITAGAAALLEGDDGDGDHERNEDGPAHDGRANAGVCDQLGRATAELEHAAALDPTLCPFADELAVLWTRAQELGRGLARYAERVEADPARLDEVQDRMYKLERLTKQHGTTLDDVILARERIARDLDELARGDSRLPSLVLARAEKLAACTALALDLSAKRSQAATALGAAIAAGLAALGMCDARVAVKVTRRSVGEGESKESLSVDGARLTRHGIDRVEIFFSPNPGIEPRSLREVASGGELSRVLLALKGVLSDRASERLAGIQVLDEIDAGVGGATADCIGRAVLHSSRHRQILCVTHLANIAVYADAHFVVHKEQHEGTTTSHAAPVTREGRVAELARMLTGSSSSGSTQRTARDLLSLARRAQVAA